MPKRGTSDETNRIEGFCDLDHRSFPISISDITPDGCLAEGNEDWGEHGDGDFLHLKIANHIDINGRVLWQEGHCAGIRFFGQIHPLVLRQLDRSAA